MTRPESGERDTERERRDDGRRFLVDCPTCGAPLNKPPAGPCDDPFHRPENEELSKFDRDRNVPHGAPLTGPERLAARVVQAEADRDRALSALERLVEEMKAAGFPHDDCESCAALRVAFDEARSELPHPKERGSHEAEDEGDDRERGRHRTDAATRSDGTGDACAGSSLADTGKGGGTTPPPTSPMSIFRRAKGQADRFTVHDDDREMCRVCGEYPAQRPSGECRRCERAIEDERDRSY